LKSSEERVALENALQHRQSAVEEIPIVIDGKEYWTDDVHLSDNGILFLPFYTTLIDVLIVLFFYLLNCSPLTIRKRSRYSAMVLPYFTFFLKGVIFVS
jgi:hypothetical protein